MPLTHRSGNRSQIRRSRTSTTRIRGPRPGRTYSELVGGPLGGLLLDITGWTPQEITTGAGLVPSPASGRRPLLARKRSAPTLSWHRAWRWPPRARSAVGRRCCVRSLRLRTTRSDRAGWVSRRLPVRTGCGVHRVGQHQVLVAYRLQGVGGVWVVGVGDDVRREAEDVVGDARRRRGGGVPCPVPQRGQRHAPGLVQHEEVRARFGLLVRGRGGPEDVFGQPQQEERRLRGCVRPPGDRGAAPVCSVKRQSKPRSA